MTIPMVMTIVAMIVWLFTVFAEQSKVIVWLGDLARLTFFAGMLATLLSLSAKVVF